MRPVCIRILRDDEHNKDLPSYDAELYSGQNDGNNNYLTNIDTNLDTTPSTFDISTYNILTQQHENRNNVFPLENCCPQQDNMTKVLQIKMNLTQQMDSGANKNVTNDIKIIRNFTTITSIPIFGIGDDTAACHITGKGITALSTIDGSTLDIIMYFAPQCSGTIISPNAIVRDNKSFTSWMQTSHLDTGRAEINFYHRTDYTKNRTLLMHMSNDLWFLQQQYQQMVQSANRTKICVLRDYDAISPFLVHKLNKLTEYELWHQRLMHPGIHAWPILINV